MTLAICLFGLVLAPFVFGAPHHHEALVSAPPTYKFVGPAPAEHSLELRLALAQNDPDGLIAALYDVSDPASSNYRNHLSKAQVAQFVAPKSGAVDAVNAWLAEHNLTGTTASPAGDWVSIQLPVSKANTLFSANFSKFSNIRAGTEVVRTLAYALPAALQGHVDFVHPTVSFADPTARVSGVAVKRPAAANDMVKRDNVPEACNNGTTPACLQYVYGIPTEPAVNTDNFLGVTGRHGGSAGYSWLEYWLKALRPDMDPETNFTTVGIDGGSNDQNAPSVTEGNLDIQYTLGIATGVPIVYYFVGDRWQDGPEYMGWLDEANYLLALDNPPQVMTTSWGAYQETALSQPVTERICQAYAQLGARGVSFLVASLDNGPGCAADNKTNFLATFPSNCPYVTSVGGTINYDTQIAWSGSSGGFTNYFPTPEYQQSAVSAYLSKHGADPQNAGRYNASGRGFPDISALADGYKVYESIWWVTGGTSAASPVIASMVALVNDRLRSAGKPPLGWLNPLLYSEQGVAAITDIVAGNSSIKCTEDDPLRGFDAVPGWDPATGLGTITFDKLSKLAGL